MTAHTTSVAWMEKMLSKNITGWILLLETLFHLHIQQYAREPNPVLDFIRNTCWSIRDARLNSCFADIKDRIEKALVSGLILLSLE